MWAYKTVERRVQTCKKLTVNAQTLKQLQGRQSQSPANSQGIRTWNHEDD